MKTPPLLAAWQTHCEHIQNYLAAIPKEALATKLEKGRTVGAMLAHLHNNRLDWLKPCAPDLMTDLQKFPRGAGASKDQLLQFHSASAEAIQSLLARSLEVGGKIKNFSADSTSFMAYLIAHDFYHLGEIGILIGSAGVKLDQKTAYGIWNW